jgi:hypothetical protein
LILWADSPDRKDASVATGPLACNDWIGIGLDLDLAGKARISLKAQRQRGILCAEKG